METSLVAAAFLLVGSFPLSFAKLFWLIIWRPLGDLKCLFCTTWTTFYFLDWCDTGLLGLCCVVRPLAIPRGHCKHQKYFRSYSQHRLVGETITFVGDFLGVFP